MLKLKNLRITNFRWDLKGQTEKNIPAEFNDHLKVFSGRPTGNLLRQLGLLKLCSIKLFSNNAFVIFNSCLQLFGPAMFGYIFKPLVYDLYIAGDSRKEILQTMERMEKRGLKPLLSPMLEDSPGEGIGLSEEILRLNLESIESCIELADQGCQLKPKTLAIKLSAFIPSPLLASLSSYEINHKNLDDLSGFIQSQKRIGFELEPQLVCQLREAAKDMLKICNQCKAKGVVLLIDAEYSHLQQGVRLISLALIKIFNKKDSIVIVNTYQCYLKRNWDDLNSDLSISYSSDFVLGCKIVRGAYLESEKSLSSKLNLPYPIHDNIEATHANYNRVIEMVLSRMAPDPRLVHVIFATHNLDSVLLAVDLMQKLRLEKSKSIHFAQINGMTDQVSSGLVTMGFSVLKLVPCGTVEQVLPWLSRRMQENGSVFERSKWERKVLTEEIKRRTMKKIVNS